MNKKWTEVEKQAILSNYNSMTDIELCQLLQGLGKGHSLDSVRKFRQRLNLKKSKGRPAKIKKDTPNQVYGEAVAVRGQRANTLILDEDIKGGKDEGTKES